MEKLITIKESKDRSGFVSPLEFSDDFSEDEKTRILNLYFQEMVRGLIENRREEEFVESIKNILRLNKYTVMQSVSAPLTYSPPASQNTYHYYCPSPYVCFSGTKTNCLVYPFLSLSSCAAFP